jgi:glyoxylase-like metal-dependent hydrolase (beta-lactamase superfamily II)
MRMVLILTMAAVTVTGAQRPSDAIPSVDDAFVRLSVPVTARVSLIYKPEGGAGGPGSLVAPFEGNVTVIEQDTSLVVVDAGGSPLSGRHVVEEIRKISSKPVAWLIYTHYHGDHNLGAGALREAWPAMRIVSTEATKTNMTGTPMEYAKTYDNGYQETLDFARQQYDDPATPAAVKEGWAGFIRHGKSMVSAYAGMHAWPADETFTTTFSIPDDIAPVELRYLGRANTDGDAIVWLPKQRVLVSGDIVVHPMPYASATYPKDWIAALQALKAIDYKYLIPGHGAVLTDTAYLDTLIGALSDVRTQIGALAAQGLTFEEARAKWDFTKLKTTFCGDDPWKRFLLNAFYLGALTQNAWKEAKGIPIVQGKDVVLLESVYDA